MIEISELNFQQADFWPMLSELLAWEGVSDAAITDTVRNILADVKQRGDQAVVEYSQRFDRVKATAMAELEIPLERAAAALESIPAAQRQALEKAAERVRQYHEHQKQESWHYVEADGTLLGQQVTPLDRAGLYVPGGKAAYPSSVLMNAIPAKVAGVQELIMVVPTPDDEVNDLVLAAAAIAGVDRIFAIGGAQAVAALAYGTETIPQVDKIVGPGNIFVATAKGMVFGTVGIDMIAGPSEILVICDGKTDPDWIAMDLFSQAEHDEDAQSILISPDAAFLQKVKESIARLLPTMERKAIIETSLNNRGAMILVEDMQQAIEVCNYIAPEHLELSVDEPMEMAKKIRHAGAIFMGRYTPEALGDYCAGPNHVLPTSRTARFSSPLGVYDFQKRSSLIQVSPQGAQSLGQVASVLARGESLTAHARSAEYRLQEK
ncbi:MULTISPECIES: histidinol dehydrogenase [unclassified Methylophaga]|jgi:histidinol dehydrogenase|uniref:histidinol dehydrogenase n=1 Tax=unclassified Methylophaga TaxID=2629249 RepID=UPI000C598F4D|nr:MULTISPECIES: histidinol dehydrogenase [unclassified Methylophaga]MAP26842.1 histidinol dehydrogenase [Methylophaga sp.]MBP25880.1 histidinol dehydrogenase [Methylophaga sp.]HAD30923.1 histidinol dehydrogenase [Methylophaga sp.]HCN99843.1 histidinol dehydrogenase [Methylophaga sp.]|tara:strand:- start:2713 stop:4017 length:1305 start_codon:yes stop_codon:yes gene_type:complete